MDALQRARELVGGARSVVVLSGAGISAESGVPTFRGEDGLWKSFRPEQLATPAAFAADPRLVWEWYAWRRERVAACRPNPGHEALARFCGARDATLVTQNVDGLHRLAATDHAGKSVAEAGHELLELHGSLFAVRCTGCTFRRAHRDPVDATTRDALPRCPSCGGLLRPDVVWFGEALDAGVLGRAFEAAAAADLCLVVGTSALVHPAASVPLAAVRSGARLVEVNPEPTPLSSLADAVLRGPAGTLLPALLS